MSRAQIGSSGWPHTSALQSPWKLAATTIEVQCSLKQMGERMLTEEADFVAEMAPGVGPTIACKFVNAGFTCIANIEGVKTPRRSEDGPTAFLVVNSVAQDGFIEALANNIQTFEAILAQPTSTPKLDARRSSDASCQLMALLLQFMAFRGVWTSKARSLSEGLCKSIFNLALAHGAGDDLNPTAFPLFLDTYMCRLHDALCGESVFARDWAETRISLTDETTPRCEDEDTGGVMHAIAAAHRSMSPASPACSRQPATSSRLQSPTQQSLTRGSASRSDEPRDMGRSSVGSRQPGKRKASTVSSDSDIEVIDTPPALKGEKVNARPPPGKQRAGREK